MEAKMENENRGKSYYEMNKQRILESMKAKVVCDRCNKTVVKSHLNRHKKTKYCQLEKYKNIFDKEDEVDFQVDLRNRIAELELKNAQLQ